MSAKHTAKIFAAQAREAGYQVGIVFDAEADKYFRVSGRKYGHAAAVSVYKEGLEVARVTWSYVSMDRTRFGAALSFAGIREGDKFKDLGELRKVLDRL